MVVATPLVKEDINLMVFSGACSRPFSDSKNRNFVLFPELAPLVYVPWRRRGGRPAGEDRRILRDEFDLTCMLR